MLVPGQLIPIKRCSDKYLAELTEKGYDTNKYPIFVKPEDLMEHSSLLVEVVCDYCGKHKKIKYGKYTRAMNGIVKKTCCQDCQPRKMAESNLIVYGDTSTNRVPEVMEKKKQVYLEKYGYDNPMKSPEVQKVLKDSFYEKYGYAYSSQVPSIKEKAKQTNIKKYGHPYWAQNTENLEKRKQHNLDKYGVEHTLQLDEVRRSIAKTKYEKNSSTTSKEQIRIASLFGGILNYPVDRYNVDIFISENNIVIEYDGSGHDILLKYKSLTEKEFAEKEKKRTNIILNEGYKIIRFIDNSNRPRVTDEKYQQAYLTCCGALSNALEVQYNLVTDELSIVQ